MKHGNRGKGPLQIKKAVYTTFNTFIPLLGPQEMKTVFITVANFLCDPKYSADDRSKS